LVDHWRNCQNICQLFWNRFLELSKIGVGSCQRCMCTFFLIVLSMKIKSLKYFQINPVSFTWKDLILSFVSIIIKTYGM
jgi:hypothetical protein